jgi:hypothetical protein
MEALLEGRRAGLRIPELSDRRLENALAEDRSARGAVFMAAARGRGRHVRENSPRR